MKGTMGGLAFLLSGALLFWTGLFIEKRDAEEYLRRGSMSGRVRWLSLLRANA